MQKYYLLDLQSRLPSLPLTLLRSSSILPSALNIGLPSLEMYLMARTMMKNKSLWKSDYPGQVLFGLVNLALIDHPHCLVLNIWNGDSLYQRLPSQLGQPLLEHWIRLLSDLFCTPGASPGNSHEEFGCCYEDCLIYYKTTLSPVRANAGKASPSAILEEKWWEDVEERRCHRGGGGDCGGGGDEEGEDGGGGECGRAVRRVRTFS